MSLGIVKKVKIMNLTDRYFNKMIMWAYYSNNEIDFLPAMKGICFLYVDFINSSGELKTIVFANHYYYKEMTFVFLEEQDGKYVITKQASSEDLKEHIDDLKLLSEKEKEKLEKERQIIKEYYGELKSQIYNSDREDIINYLDNIITGNIRNLKSKLIELARYLLKNTNNINREQYEGYKLLVTDLASNFNKINNQLISIGEEEIDPQLVIDIANILNDYVKCSFPQWKNCPMILEIESFHRKQLIKYRYGYVSGLEKKYGIDNK